MDKQDILIILCYSCEVQLNRRDLISKRRRGQISPQSTVDRPQKITQT